ncbi:hypothetical protein [Spirilliplanes yamanashiensis]|uniref:Uncharacterized protein n=1 Tax=Spirilliplanes yamanashiensis TaxID=42233 RepID=A0A8J3YEQ2_9ACTN|nr:hypothetical protein [Spirilliplanes yamanashiensis]MDP9818309.1 hypothetical protein [Spirilliplanes yamanashiensis]GIJ06724.1 hypothetical protein Sya03_60760 [Spirilliplanes yamanashiensis]
MKKLLTLVQPREIVPAIDVREDATPVCRPDTRSRRRTHRGMRTPSSQLHR